MNQVDELKSLYRDAEQAGDTVLQDKIIARLESMQTQQPANQPQAAPVQPVKSVQAVQNKQPTPEEIGFLQDFAQDFTEAGKGLGSSLHKRKRNITSVLERHNKGEISGEKGALLMMAQMIVGGLEIPVAGLSAISPDLVKEWVNQEINENLDTPQGKLFLKGVDSFNKWAGENPELSETIIAGIQVAGGVAAASKSGLVKGAGTWKGKPNIQKSYKDMMKPVQGKTVREVQVDNTIVSPIMEKFTVKPTLKEKQILELLQDTPGVKPNNLAQVNYNAIKAAGEKLRVQLIRDLRQANIQISRNEIKGRLTADLKTAFDTEAIFVGASEKRIFKIREQVLRIMDKNKKNVEGLLKTRKQLDKLKENAKGWNEGTRKAIKTVDSEAYKIARNALNDLLQDKAPNIDVMGSTYKQHLYIEANKVLKPKAALERATKVGRTAEKLGETPVIGRLFDNRSALKRNK